MNCALKALSTEQQRTKCNSVSCATLHNGQIRSLSVCPLYWYMYKNVWNTQLKPCHYKFQMPINIHLQIRFRIMNSAKFPINIKFIATGNAIFAIDKQLIFHEKHVKTGSFLPHLDSAIQNKSILIQLTTNIWGPNSFISFIWYL